MRCVNCGSFLDQDSRFCKNCGTSIRDVEETRIARPQASTPARYQDDDDLESVVFTVRPTLLFVKIGYGLAILSRRTSERSRSPVSRLASTHHT